MLGRGTRHKVELRKRKEQDLAVRQYQTYFVSPCGKNTVHDAGDNLPGYIPKPNRGVDKKLLDGFKNGEYCSIPIAETGDLQKGAEC